MSAIPLKGNYTMSITETLILAVLFAFQAAVTGFDWIALAEGFGFSFTGAVILAYFRREQSRGEQAFKALAATIVGFVCGSAVVEYLAIAVPRYVWLTFFLSGILSLTVIRALLNLSEQHATEVCRDMLQRFLKLQTPEERKHSRGRRRPEGRLKVTPDEEEKENVHEPTRSD